MIEKVSVWKLLTMLGVYYCFSGTFDPVKTKLRLMRYEVHELG